MTERPNTDHGTGSLPEVSEPIFHIATRTEWAAARSSGEYTTSTRGVSLAEEGFIHASRRAQVPGVFARYYADAKEPLVLLQIDPKRLKAQVRFEQVGTDTYPHIYGPIIPSAVLSALPLNRRGGTESFSGLFMKDMMLRIVLALVAMLCAFMGAELGREFSPTLGPVLGALIGLAVGGVAGFWIHRSRN